MGPSGRPAQMQKVMKNIHRVLPFLALFWAAACDPSVHLQQQNAEAAVRTLLSADPPPGAIADSLRLEFDAADQFAEHKVSMQLRYATTAGEAAAPLRVIFKRNARHQWFLKKIASPREAVSDSLRAWLERQDGLNIPVQ